MIRQEQCDKVCRIIDNFLANRPTERDSLIAAVQKAFDTLEQAETNCSEIPNNSDTISRQQAIDALRDYLVEKRCPDDGTLTCRLIENEVINKLPSAQSERKTGRWTLRRVTYLWEGVECEKFETRCSSCGCLPISGIKSTYCPNCGADMRGEG